MLIFNSRNRRGDREACPLKPKRAAVQTITVFHGLVCSCAQSMATLIETIAMQIIRAASGEREHSMIQFDLAGLTEALKPFPDISEEGVVP